MKGLAIITGAASGIGLALAMEVARDGYALLLVDKDEAGLRQIADKIKNYHDGLTMVTVLVDLTGEKAVERIRKEVDERQFPVAMLINCAGFGVYGRFDQTGWKREREMIQLHVLASTYLIKEFLPEMISRKQGRIMNVASLAGFVPGPMMAVYYATKAYMISLTRALAAEMKDTGVTFTVLCPGVTDTQFSGTVHGKTTAIAKHQFLSSNSEEVAKCAYRALLKGKKVVIPGVVNRLLFIFQRIVPSRWAVHMVKHSQEKIRSSIGLRTKV